jgi:hypothetical protein
MNRIRYTKTRNPSIIRSVRNFQGQQGAIYQVKINTEDNTYKVINVSSQRVIRSTEKDGKKSPKNLYTVKEQVKKALKSVGVKFDHEFRGIDAN